MPPDATQTVIESTGSLYVAPVGTPFPDGYEAPADPWVDLGHISTDGPRPSGFERDAERFYSWQSPKTPIRSVPGQAEPQCLADLLQVNERTLMLYFGGGTWTPGTGGEPDVYTPPLGDPAEQALVIDWFDGARQYRWCFKRTVPIAGGEINLTSAELATWPVRFDILASGDGTPAFEIRLPAAGAATLAAPTGEPVPAGAAA
jgi:hypothetical protein